MAKKIEKKIRDLNKEGFVICKNDGTKIVVEEEDKRKPWKPIAIGGAGVAVIVAVAVGLFKLLGGEHVDPDVVEAIVDRIDEAADAIDPDVLIEP